MTLEVAPANHEGPSYPPLVLSTDLGGVLNNTVGGGTRRAGLAGDACALSFRGGLASRERSAPGRPRICRCLPVGRPATADGGRYWPGGYRGGLTCVATRALSPGARVVSQGELTAACGGGVVLPLKRKHRRLRSLIRTSLAGEDDGSPATPPLCALAHLTEAPGRKL